jgi:crotonobetainyl-CoA:carnitine CoA-transferase CaiB-like acyl-CoA transferase
LERGALEGLRVVEYATMVPGPFCGKLLADLGADVIKVEPPEGDPARRMSPFQGEDPHPEKSPLFLYLNTNKRGITLSTNHKKGTEVLRGLIRWAHVLIDDHPPAHMEDLGLGWQELQRINPSLIYTSITPYGRSGPRSNAKGDELTLVHAGGLGNLLPTRSEDIVRPPVKLGGYQAGYYGGLAAAVATMAAYLGARRSSGGRLVEISIQEVILAMVNVHVANWRYHGTTWSRVPDRPPAMGRMRTMDGYVVLNALDDHHFRALRNLMGNPPWASSTQWDSLAYRIHHLWEIAENLDEWMLHQRRDEIHHKAAGLGIPIGPVNDARDIMNNPQYRARGYFVEVEHPVAGRHMYAGWPYRMSRTPPGMRRPAPLLGQHNREVLTRVLGYKREEVESLQSEGICSVARGGEDDPD